ncbi:Crp/Fnr family transcriptional regulator [Mucilaginibacter sp. OK283]|jgi:CRP-like cAMP-binding protein|uniref:Crp/Fnr family transcriptional regulator n=1 Tax=Mucilaginibacter sp. OK283 TaxID=1881049 RepID=UPI0008AB7295|nr:Crp/Fnr family transcriptional regulator [Mucilaginibacter sp. OK283]SEP04561.1 cAMP-binding domain of CRP or a regulatory subunit of cAMP-dependent protein kinases [Mucilaginibacter sp. OK283]
MHPVLKQYFSGKIDLSAGHEALIDRCFKLKHAKRNEILVPKGSVAKNIYFVIKGCLRVFLVDDSGNESTRFLIFENNMGTAFPSFINGTPSLAAIQSLEASELLVLSRHDRDLLLKVVPGWETMYRIGLEQDYIASIQRIESLITMDSKTRYQVLMDTRPDIIRRLPNKIVADYLGISQETLSRLKAHRPTKA